MFEITTVLCLQLISGSFANYIAHPGVSYSPPMKPSPKTTYIDLSYSFNNDTVYWPGQKVEFSVNKEKSGITPQGYWYAAYTFCMAEHGGTHLDAPFHFHKSGWTLDQIPPSHLIDIPATVIDVSDIVFGKSNHLPDEFLLEVNHIINHESSHGQIPFGGLVLLHTGWGRFWPNKQKYLGYDNTTTDTPILRFPGCSLDAARWLHNERNIVGFGIDTPSVDPGDSKGEFPVHVEFGEENIYNLENVANLHLAIQETTKNRHCDLHTFILPLKMTGATGGPTRILVYCKP